MRTVSSSCDCDLFGFLKMTRVLYSSLSDSDFMSGFILEEVCKKDADHTGWSLNTLNAARQIRINQYFCSKENRPHFISSLGKTN